MAPLPWAPGQPALQIAQVRARPDSLHRLKRMHACSHSFRERGTSVTLADLTVMYHLHAAEPTASSLRSERGHCTPLACFQLVCLPGFGGPTCVACAAGTFSPGGNQTMAKVCGHALWPAYIPF